jgi:hypothetical protein
MHRAMPINAAIIDSLNVPKELTLEFFAAFARFEYALKRAGYVVGDDKSASPSWDRFAVDLRDMGDAALAPVIAACVYLREHPPKKQVVNNGNLEWAVRPAAGSPIEDVLLSVRTVRNNVFHGGKFPTGIVEEPLRDRRLIEECLAVLNALLDLQLPHNVAGYFKA